jgi:AcrR family transcriptional regulator
MVLPDSRIGGRQRVLDAARELFIERGFNGTNLRDIAAHAQVSMGGIYHHFDSKQEIFRTLLSENDLAPHVRSFVQALHSPDLVENLEVIGSMIWHAVAQSSDFFRLAYIDILEFGGQNFAPVLRTFRELMNEEARLVLEPQMESGALRRLPTEAVIRAVLCLFVHTQLEDSMVGFGDEERGIAAEEIIKAYADILRHGILGPAED